jgi:hypothetical protein
MSKAQAAALFFGQQVARIELRQPPELGPVVEQAGVEKIRAHAPGLGLELPEAQHARLHGKLHEFLCQRAVLVAPSLLPVVVLPCSLEVPCLN